MVRRSVTVRPMDCCQAGDCCFGLKCTAVWRTDGESSGHFLPTGVAQNCPYFSLLARTLNYRYCIHLLQMNGSTIGLMPAVAIPAGLRAQDEAATAEAMKGEFHRIIAAMTYSICCAAAVIISYQRNTAWLGKALHSSP